jgi:hypothetical protein
MRILGVLVLASLLGIPTLQATPCKSGPGVWHEGDFGQGDAGKFFGASNVTVGIGNLTEICGNLADSDSGGDMYAIFIDSETFSAFTSAIGPKGIADPALYLFDQDGKGLYANNDFSSSTTQAGFTLSGLTPGLYFIEITPDNQQPENAAGKLIFGNITGTNTTLFTPVVKGTELHHYTDTGDSGGTYGISLTNALFLIQFDTSVPEPATLGLVGGGLGLLFFARRYSLTRGESRAHRRP